MKIDTTKLFLILIFILHMALRIYKLDQIPYGFHRDEAYVGYNAYSILKTGKDEWGVRFPLFSRSFGDYPPSLVLYGAIPFVALFGLNEFGVRLSTVFFSLVNFYLIYKILSRLKLKKGLIFIVLGVIAISPWELTQVRGANGDLILGVSLFLAGVYYLISFWQEQKYRFLWLFGFTWLLTYFSYNSFRIQIPLLLLPLSVLFFHNRKLRTKKWILAIFLLLIILPFTLPYIFPGSEVRSKQTLFIYNPSFKQSLQVLAFQTGLMEAPLKLTRLFHNKFSYFTFSFIKNTVRLLSLEFFYLFEAYPRRYAVPENGLLLYTTAPFLILGMILFSNSRRKNYYKYLLFYFLFVGLLPSIITHDDFPNSKRCFLSFYPLVFWIALGIYTVWERIKFKKIYGGVMILLLTLNSFYFWFFYKYHSPFLVSHTRNYFYKQIAEVIKDNENKYDKFKLYSYSESPHILLLFFIRYDPRKYQLYSKPSYTDFFSLEKEWGFDKYIFTPDTCPYPGKGELIFVENSKCEKYLNKWVTSQEIDIGGYVHSPYGSKEFVYYQLKDNG